MYGANKIHKAKPASHRRSCLQGAPTRMFVSSIQARRQRGEEEKEKDKECEVVITALEGEGRKHKQIEEVEK